ncbi:YidC family membrane integrase SpoIIIJ [Aciduricibacillus chroicocephali]|uniref:Membrane protein insertase YidC n=1 Tax=Aciduricibacillus chroicocephali TaxID=3054939 RepID=A0ABY9KVB9_9BACI|nr:YidC family membrane integrase SpoIIIJ [Bacillaceae bacterium 44XB]
MRKKLLITLALVGLVLVLSGCGNVQEPVTAQSSGWWDKYFVYQMSRVITYFAQLFHSNYGLSIVVVTVIIRLVLLPLNVKQLKSSRAMQEIQPKLKEVQAKYSSKDANTQQKLQQETMKLFQENGVNPLAGCLPIVVQMPILFAIYQAIMRTAEIKKHDFLWFQLGSPDYVLPVIAGAATFLQQKLMMAGSEAGSNPQMQVMLYVMPVMITVMAFFFPSALALYWVVGNIFMVAQTLLINNPFKKTEAASAGRGKKS